MPNTRLFLAVPVAVLALAACDRGGGGASEAVVRDSAGVAIVENGERGAWGDGGWTLSDEPAVDIGLVEGEAAYQLDKVRSAVRLGDGRIAVANGGSGEIRFFDAAGKHLLSAGGKGGGPGEFTGLARLQRAAGDTLVAWDQLASRLSYFSPDGRFVRSVAVGEGLGSPVRYADRFSDGALLLTRSERKFSGAKMDGLSRDTFTIARRAPGADAIDSLLTVPGDERMIFFDGNSINVFTVPFLRRTLLASTGDGFWAGSSDGYTLQRRRSDGTLERIVRRNVAPVPVEGAYLDSLRSVSRRESGEAAGSSPVDRAPKPASLPAFNALLVDDGGNLWVERFPWPGDPQPRWDVFDREGKLLGTVTLPARFRPTHVGDDFVLGVWEDDLEVQHVRMYRLLKG